MQKENQIHGFLSHLNSQHTNIKFTLEEEKNYTLPFLYILLQRHPDRSISINVYRKPTPTYQYLNFNSHHNYRPKQRVVTTLFQRAHALMSNTEEVKKEEDRQHNVLNANGYQPSFVKRSLAKTEITNRTDKSDPVTKVNLPYVHKISESIRRIISRHNIHSTYDTQSTLRSILSKPEDPAPPEKKNNVAY